MEEATVSTVSRLSSRVRYGGVLFKAVWRFRNADATALAAETAYFSILAVAPFLLFLITGIAAISQFMPIGLVEDLERTVARMAPGDTGELLLPLVEQAVDRRDSGGALSFGLIGSIVVGMWSSSRAISSLIKGSSRIHGVTRDRPMIWNRIISLGLALVMGSVLMLSVVLFLFGRGIGRIVAESVNQGDTFTSIWVYASWPLMGGIILLMLSLFYWLAIGRHSERLRFISLGAVIATALWALVMLGIRVFIWIVDPGSVYGALGTFMVLVVFSYIMSLAILFGAAVNVELLETDTTVEPTN